MKPDFLPAFGALPGAAEPSASAIRKTPDTGRRKDLPAGLREETEARARKSSLSGDPGNLFRQLLNRLSVAQAAKTGDAREKAWPGETVKRAEALPGEANRTGKSLPGEATKTAQALQDEATRMPAPKRKVKKSPARTMDGSRPQGGKTAAPRESATWKEYRDGLDASAEIRSPEGTAMPARGGQETPSAQGRTFPAQAEPPAEGEPASGKASVSTAARGSGKAEEGKEADAKALATDTAQNEKEEASSASDPEAIPAEPAVMDATVLSLLPLPALLEGWDRPLTGEGGTFSASEDGFLGEGDEGGLPAFEAASIPGRDLERREAAMTAAIPETGIALSPPAGLETGAESGEGPEQFGTIEKANPAGSEAVALPETVSTKTGFSGGYPLGAAAGPEAMGTESGGAGSLEGTVTGEIPREEKPALSPASLREFSASTAAGKEQISAGVRFAETAEPADFALPPGKAPAGSGPSREEAFSPALAGKEENSSPILAATAFPESVEAPAEAQAPDPGAPLLEEISPVLEGQTDSNPDEGRKDPPHPEANSTAEAEGGIRGGNPAPAGEIGSFEEVLELKRAGQPGPEGTPASAPAPASSSEGPAGTAPAKETLRAYRGGTAGFERDIFRQVATKITNWDRSGGEVFFRLNPGHLGEVRIALNLKQGLLQGRVAVENEGVKNLLEASLPQLREALEAQGLKLSELDVQVGREDRRKDEAGAEEGIPGRSRRSPDGETGLTEEEAKGSGREGGKPRRWGYHTWEMTA